MIEKSPPRPYHRVTFTGYIRYGFKVDTYSLFYKENKDRLYAYLLRMTGEAPLAADLVQESFTRYIARYGGRDGNRSLLYTIARNAGLDAIRKQQPDCLSENGYEDPRKNPEQQMMDRQAFERLLKAIGKLTPSDRELISLVATADLSYREMGTILNISEANVKVKVHRARMKLREILGSGGG